MAESGLAEVARNSVNVVESPVRCLVIDKEASGRQQLVAWLHGLGVECVADGSLSADAMMAAGASDLILAEASDARTNDALLQLAQRRNAPAIVLYTDAPDLALVERSILDGAADFMVKPFDEGLLRFKLEQAGLLKAA